MSGSIKTHPFESKKVIMTTEETPLKGSVKWDSPDGGFDRGMMLVEFPKFQLNSPEQPSAPHRPYSNSASPVEVWIPFDKSAARILGPFVEGVNLGTIKIKEVGRAANNQEVPIQEAIMSNAFVEKIAFAYEERLAVLLPPGGFLEITFKYGGLTLIATEFGPNLEILGSTTGTFDMVNAAVPE